jgi:hypothetical protein
MGIAGAGLIYWEQVRHATATIDELLPDSSRANRRQMGILYGTAGAMTVDLEESVRRPGTQMVLVLGACAALAGLCFQIARSYDEDDES